MNRWYLPRRDEGREMANEGRANHPDGIGNSFIHKIQPAGTTPPDYYDSSALKYGHVYQDPQRNFPEYLAMPRSTRPRDPATRNPTWVPIVQRTGMRYKDTEEDEGKGLLLSLALLNTREEPSLTLTVGRDSFGKGKKAVKISRSKNYVNSAMMQSTLELKEYGKCLSLRPPDTEDNNRKHAIRLPRVGWTGQVYHSGGVGVLTDYVEVNPNGGFKFIPFSFNWDKHGHLVPTGPFNRSFSRGYGKGADNFVQASNPYVNDGRGHKSLGASANNEQGTQAPPDLTNPPIYEAHGRGSGSLFPIGYPDIIQGHGLRFMPAALPDQVYDEGNGVMASMNGGLTYKIVDDNESASSSTGKKDIISKGKVILIPDDASELCKQTDTVLITRTTSSDSTGNQEQVNLVSMRPINRGKGLLIRRDALRTYQTETLQTGERIEKGRLYKSCSSRLPEEGLDTTGMTGKRKREGERRPRQRRRPIAFPTDVRSLLSTGVLDGIPVKYATWMRDKVLRGVIARDKILCGCQECNHTTPINPLEFERHAGGNTKHPNNHIHFPNGKTIYEIVQGLQKVPSTNLFQAMETMAGYPLNQEKFEAWKALYRASGIEARKGVTSSALDAQG